MRMTRFTRDDGAAVFIDLDTIMTVEPCQIEKGQCFVRLVGGAATTFLDMPAEDVANLVRDMPSIQAPVATVTDVQAEAKCERTCRFPWAAGGYLNLDLFKIMAVADAKGGMTNIFYDTPLLGRVSCWLIRMHHEDVLTIVNNARRAANMPPLGVQNDEGQKENRFYRETEKPEATSTAKSSGDYDPFFYVFQNTAGEYTKVALLDIARAERCVYGINDHNDIVMKDGTLHCVREDLSLIEKLIAGARQAELKAAKAAAPAPTFTQADVNAARKDGAFDELSALRDLINVGRSIEWVRGYLHARIDELHNS